MTILTRIRSGLTAPMARPAIAAFALAFAVACSGGEGGGGAASTAVVNPYLEDVTLGDAAAPVDIVEYASLTCPHCRDFWKQDFQRLKTTYIDTGKVKYTLRDYPTPPVELAVAGTAIARCAGKDGYYAVIDSFYDRYADIMDAARDGTAGPILVEIGAKHGLSVDEVRACIDHKGVRDFVEKTARESDGVRSTPTIFINGQRQEAPTYAILSASIEAILNPAPADESSADAPAADAPAAGE